MPVNKLLNENKKISKVWHIFNDGGSIERGTLRSVINDSWVRSKEMNIDPFNDEIEKELTLDELILKTQDFQPLIDVAKPFMKTLYQTVGDMGLIVRFTDSDGYVLECFGDESVISSHKELHLFKGTNVSENMIGTNAIGLALKKKIPIQVLGAEHFRKDYHNWTSSAAPIKDSDGNVLAVISMSGDFELVHPHTLGMVLASAQAIENEIELEKINLKLLRASDHAFAIMESIYEGILCIDELGNVNDINRFARKLLGVKKDEAKGRSIYEFLSTKNARKMLSVISSSSTYEEREIQFINSRNKNISCILTVTPIKASETDINEAVFTFRESKKVHNLVNQIIGANAPFTLEDIIGESKEIKEAVEMARLIADTEATILLHGESGTGKELFAQGIHNASKRCDNSFIFLNCGAIPRDLVASELFGYEEGAFTGAKKGGHPGKFELAEGGTIFLDEIGDMPLDAQVNLLRVLETKQVMRVGGHDVIPVDIRVIAASHKDLSEEVEKGNFRKDLYFRLKVFPIHTPSLRERRTDIRPLIDFFLESFLRKEGKGKLTVQNSFYNAMQDYDWPGNVRELQNVMQLVTSMSHHRGELVAEDLPDYLKKTEVENVEDILIKLQPLSAIEKAAIITALKSTGGNLVQTAKVLAIGRSTLYRKMEKYHIETIQQ